MFFFEKPVFDYTRLWRSIISAWHSEINQYFFGIIDYFLLQDGIIIPYASFSVQLFAFWRLFLKYMIHNIVKFTVWEQFFD